MYLEQLTQRLTRDDRLDRVADRLQPIAEKVTRPDDPERTSLLSGTDLGHPAHPMLTDVAIGFLTSATVLDWLPGRSTRRAADVLLTLGLAATAPTAMTGMRDWLDIKPAETRRLGAAHAASNTVASSLFVWSLLKRMAGRRGKARLFSLLGATALSFGGYLGGHLTYRKGVGVDENAFDATIDEWTATVALDDLPDNQPTCVTADGVDVLLYRRGERVEAIANRCSHLGGPLHEGHVHETDGAVSCPWHHSTFRLADGGVIRGPASHPQPHYDTMVRDGVVHVRTPASA